MKLNNPITLSAFSNTRGESIPGFSFRSAVAPTLCTLELVEEGDVIVSYIHNGEKKNNTYTGVDSLSLFVVADAGTIVRVKANLQNLYCNTNQLQELNVSGLTNLQNLDCSTNHKILSIRYNAIKKAPSNSIADLITDATATDGTVYLDADDEYYSTVADAATAKGWTVAEL